MCVSGEKKMQGWVNLVPILKYVRLARKTHLGVGLVSSITKRVDVVDNGIALKERRSDHVPPAAAAVSAVHNHRDYFESAVIAWSPRISGREFKGVVAVQVLAVVGRFEHEGLGLRRGEGGAASEASRVRNEQRR